MGGGGGGSRTMDTVGAGGGGGGGGGPCTLDTMFAEFFNTSSMYTNVSTKILWSILFYTAYK